MNVIRYLETGVDEADLPLIAQLENVVRKKEAGLEATASLNGPKDVMALLQQNPRALERPILIVDGQAVIGRPPENVLTLLKRE